MSLQNRRHSAAAKLASALCILSAGGGSAIGGNVPKLIRTTSPIRVEPFPGFDQSQPSGQGVEQADSTHSVDPAARELRTLLDPNRSYSVDQEIKQTAGGAPRTNHFVELNSDGVIDTTRNYSRIRSAAVPQRDAHRRGAIQKNPLVVDSPPELRRFPVDERPLVLPKVDAVDGILVAREQPLPPQPVADLEAALDVLSTEPDADDAIRGTARSGGFGMLAIDQIGDHLDDQVSTAPSIQHAPLRRFTTDLVLPPDEAFGLQSAAVGSSLRQQLGSVETDSLIDESLIDDSTPQLPPPTVSDEEVAIAKSLELFGQAVESSSTASAAATQNMHGVSGHRVASRSNGSPRVALEVDELLAASSEQQPNVAAEQKPEQQVDVAKPSLVERFSSWSRRLTSGRQSAENKAVSTRLPSGSSTTETTMAPPKRSGGILTQWLNRSR